MDYTLKTNIIKTIFYTTLAIYLTIKSTFWLTTLIFRFCWISGIISLGFLIAEWIDDRR